MTCVKFKKLDESAQLPRYQTDGASGMDLHACLPAGHESMTILAGSRLLVPTGLAMEIPFGWEAQVRPRSGLANKHGVAACLGTVDADYRGEVSVNLFNHSFQTYKVTNGERIAQLVIVPVVRCEIEEVVEMSTTARGSGGFGSTGNL